MSRTSGAPDSPSADLNAASSAPDPDALLSAKAAADAHRALSRSKKAPVGPRSIRRAFASGDLAYVEVAGKRRVFWRDFIGYVHSLRQVQPRALAPPIDDVDRAADAAVRAREGLTSS